MFLLPDQYSFLGPHSGGLWPQSGSCQDRSGPKLAHTSHKQPGSAVFGTCQFLQEFCARVLQTCYPAYRPHQQKEVIHWTVEHTMAFLGFKHALTRAPCLALPDFSRPFEIVSDASGYGIGAVLLQNKRPVAYFSRKLSDSETRYSATDKELLAAYAALVNFRPYVQGTAFTMVTDRKPNTGNFMRMTQMQIKWSSFLQSFDGVEFIYQPGRTNVADPLSRNPLYLSPLITR